jgi:hypothetical protein
MRTGFRCGSRIGSRVQTQERTLAIWNSSGSDSAVTVSVPSAGVTRVISTTCQKQRSAIMWRVVALSYTLAVQARDTRDNFDCARLRLSCKDRHTSVHVRLC